jgi:hypothetical protein
MAMLALLLAAPLFSGTARLGGAEHHGCPCGGRSDTCLANAVAVMAGLHHGSAGTGYAPFGPFHLTAAAERTVRSPGREPS